MKRGIAALIVTLMSAPLFAGMTYQFQSVTTGKNGSELAGKASVEGTNMRLDFSKGDKVIFKNNSVVISKDGGKSMFVIDPKEKTYFEFSLDDLFGALGGMSNAMPGMFKMTIENQSVKLTGSGDGGVIEGYPTKRYVVDSAYDMNIKIMGMKQNSKIKTTSETWTTEKIGREYATFVQQKGFRTGMEDLDKLIAAQTAAIKGFPLKQVLTTVSTANNKSETSVTTMTVSSLKTTTVPASQFEIPAGFKETDSPLAALQNMSK